VFVADDGSSFAIIDESGSIHVQGKGRVLIGDGDALAGELPEVVEAASRRLGPVVVAPVVRVLRGGRLVDLGIISDPRQVLAAAQEECAMAASAPMAIVISRS
jgi:hypothetical protein